MAVTMRLRDFETAHSLAFVDKDLLEMAFVHSSYVNEAAETGDIRDNERLELLGDAVLEFVVTEALYNQFPELEEGELTNLRAALVRRETLARFARKCALGEYLQLGHGEEESGGRTRSAILCATFEALIGAIYLDQGLEAVRNFVMPLVQQEIPRIQSFALGKDSKSRLQEWAQRVYGSAPKYKVIHHEGPDHAKLFTIQVLIKQQPCGVGQGPSKQEASQAAAAMALHRLGLGAAEYVKQADLEAQWPISETLLEDLSGVGESNATT
jgi:ribonuclease III